MCVRGKPHACWFVPTLLWQKCKDKGKSPNMPSFQRFVNKFQAVRTFELILRRTHTSSTTNPPTPARTHAMPARRRLHHRRMYAHTYALAQRHARVWSSLGAFAEHGAPHMCERACSTVRATCVLYVDVRRIECHAQ